MTLYNIVAEIMACYLYMPDCAPIELHQLVNLSNSVLLMTDIVVQDYKMLSKEDIESLIQCCEVGLSQDMRVEIKEV